VGFFQRLDFLLVLVVFGVESINYLEKGADGRMKRGKTTLANCYNIRSIVLK